MQGITETRLHDFRERWKREHVHDAALRLYPSNDGRTIQAAATYLHKPFRDIDDRFDLGISARHNDTGVSLTAGLTRGTATDGRDAEGYIIKGGWLTNLNSLGYTAFSIDYTSGGDVILDGDDSDSFGLFALQKWDSIGLDLYAGFRRYEVKRPDIDLRPLDTLSLEAIFTF